MFNYVYILDTTRPREDSEDRSNPFVNLFYNMLYIVYILYIINGFHYLVRYHLRQQKFFLTPFKCVIFLCN